ncbi:alpha/beta hydrolase [Homoserinibacter sp. GY 40078]|uniref:alpha/beta hydrolase n=1 Tax=Homoserinibacter sp. GY 40078 TaxID=2603275 RepID=UPI0011C73C32|nr:alpha/beta hydrolase [Homoserinibacter sp. GY 40078]TXK17075.1 hypothetical protein FVQ89_09360 [Homoserinibacter sp. GY 40078]
MFAAESHWEGNQLIEIALLWAAPVFVTGAFVMPADHVPGPSLTSIIATANSEHSATTSFDPTASTLGASGASAASADSLITSLGPVAGTSVPISQLQGIVLLDRLSTLPRRDIASYLESNPQVVSEMLADPPTSASVATWWASAPVEGRRALLNEAPNLVGGLEGVPYGTRDAANRRVLFASLDDLRETLDGFVGRAERDELVSREHMLTEVENALVSTDGHVRRLVNLDPEGEGRAVIAVGDIARADYVSFLVPGMFFGVDAQIGAWADTAEDLVVEQEEWLARLHPDGDATVAAVAWIGYRTPSLVNVASMELAREGQDALTASLKGLAGSRTDDEPYLSVLAHSYGSTAALLSLAEDDVAVDALALVGSPGSPARSVAELHVADANVWVGAADWDPIPASGVFGSQPTSAAYGAHRFSVAPGTDPVTGEALTGATSHNEYFAPGGSSLRNMALIGIGEGSLVTDANRSAGDALKKLGKSGTSSRTYLLR